MIPTIVWEETRVTGLRPAGSASASKKLRNEEALITEYSGARLRMDLDRVPLWRGDHVTLKQLWSDYSQYLYLPRLLNSAVLLDAVRSGVALLTWNPDYLRLRNAFAETAGRYSGLVAGSTAGSDLDSNLLSLSRDVAAKQLRKSRRPARRATPPGRR